MSKLIVPRPQAPPHGPARQPLHLVVADDHAPTRADLLRTLEVGGMVVVGEAGDAKRAVDQAMAHHPDVCLLDIHMPGDGVTAAAAITAALPETTVIMLTVSYEDEDLFTAVRAGAVGYLLKDSPLDRLPAAVQAVVCGEVPLPRKPFANLVNELRERPRWRARLDGRRALSPAKRRVLELVAEGLPPREVADALGIGRRDLHAHLAAALRKLSVPAGYEARLSRT